MSENNKKSKFRTMLEDGCIAEQYSLKSFVKIKPAYEIDRVKLSFVNKGTQGDGFDIYMDTQTFLLWCEDIDSFRMGKRIVRELNKYKSVPEEERKNFEYRYTYRTGEKASKMICFSPSTKHEGSIAITGSTFKDGKKQYINVVVDYNWLRKMSYMYQLTSNFYWNECAEIVLQNAKKWENQNFSQNFATSATY